MKKQKLFFAACALLLGVSNASADVTLETDLTSQFSSLTDWHNWTGATGYTAVGFCPMVEVSGGIGSKQVCESYSDAVKGCTNTGDIFYATVTGLPAGTYTIELYGGAAFTFGRGFGSDAFTGEHETGGTLGTHTSSTYSAGDHIDSGTGVTLYAQSEGETYGGEIPIYYATNFPNGAATVTIENVVVDASGQIKIGMSKTSMSTNWHVIQLKSVIATVSGDAVITSLKATANALLNNATYTNVTGSERTNLQAAYEATPAAQTQDAYEAVISALNTAISAFESCNYAAYDAFAAEKTKAAALGMDVSGYTATDAADAVTKTQTIMVDEYTHVTTNYPFSVALGTWTSTGEVGTNTGQHWDGSDSTPYYEQSLALWSSSAAWKIGYNQDVTLPAGDYVFKVAGRHGSQKTVCNTIVLTVTNSSDVELGTVADFPIGDTGLGINKSGDTSFDSEDAAGFANGGAGRGWEWRYVKFSLESEETINIAVSASSDGSYNNQWVGFCDATLETNNADVQALLAYNVALRDAISARDDAQYANVTGIEKTALIAAINADPTSNYPAATTALNEATDAFTGAKSVYDAYLLAKGYGEEINSTLLPYASSAKLDAVTTALEASVNSAATAEEAAGAINTANRAAYESNALAEGVAGATNMTYVIKNANGENTSGWSGSFSTATSESYTDASGSSTNTYFDKNGEKKFASSQTITLPKGTYILSVTARAQSGIDSYKLKVTNNADEEASIVLTAMGNANGVFGRGWNDFTMEFEQTAEGNATITIEGDNTTSNANFWMSWDRFRLVATTALTTSATVSSAGWATLYTPYALDFSGKGLTAYTATCSEGIVTLAPVTTVPANTGVVLEGDADDYNIPVIASSSTAQGDLKGSATDATEYDAFVGYTLYVLTRVDEGANVQFNPVSEGSIAAGKAFLKIDGEGTSSARALKVVFAGDVTGISEAAATTEAAQKEGKFVENGKLVIFKNGKKYNANGQLVK